MVFEDDSQDPYAVLGVGPRTPWPQIRVRFRELVKDCHPDLGSDAGRAERFLRVVGAYRVLEQILDPHEVRNAQAEETVASERSGAAGRTVELLIAANERLVAGAYKAAETLARLAIRDDPRSADAYVMLARALTRQQLYVEANGCLRMALHLDPHHISAVAELKALQHRDQATV